MNIKFFSLLITIFTLSACSLGQSDSPPQAWLKPGVKITLPEATLDHEIDRQQLLTATINGKSESLLTMLNVSNNKITLAGLSTLGIRIFKVVYDETGIKTEQSIVIPQLPPANQVLSDIMFSYWPVEVWRSHLPAGWILEESDLHRNLYDTDGKLIIEVTYHIEHNQREPIMIQHNHFGYQIKIKNINM